MGNVAARGNLKQDDPVEHAKELERQRVAVNAVLRGLTYTQAAQLAGYYDRAGAYKAVQSALARNAAANAADADQLRELQVARLNRALVEITSVAFNPQHPLDVRLKYLDAMRRNVESQAKLLNLYAPVQVEVFTTDVISLEISRLAAKLGVPVPEPRTAIGTGPAATGTVPDPEGPEGS